MYIERPEILSKSDYDLIHKDVAKKLLSKSISTAVFDRGGDIYHGRVKALAEGAREAGLKF